MVVSSGSKQPPPIAPMIIQNEIAMIEFAKQLANSLKIGDVIALSGCLGAGKSFLARAMIRCFLKNWQEVIPSPTFTLVQPYENGKFPIFHSDLYRLTHANEIEELGLIEGCQDGALIIEWPEIIEAMLLNPNHLFAKNLLWLEIIPDQANEALRSIYVRAISHDWQIRLSMIKGIPR